MHCVAALPCRTKSADKSDALQTLRAVRRRPAVAKRLECVRLQRRFPEAGWLRFGGRAGSWRLRRDESAALTRGESGSLALGWQCLEARPFD